MGRGPGLAGRVRIGGREIGPGLPAFVVAEAGVNHNGDLATALEMIRVAAEAGADAVKFQTFTADALVARDSPKAPYQMQATDTAESQHDMLHRLELTPGTHYRLREACDAAEILFLSTPFDRESADLLDAIGVPAFKIASPDLIDLPLLSHVAAKRKPMLISTGAATMAEVSDALDTVTAAGAAEVVLLHCVTSYPAEARDVNLRAMSTMHEAFSCPVGYSDHTLGPEVALAAAAMGACVIEKHFTLNRGSLGPDHRASAEPRELAALVRGVRRVAAALGDGVKAPAGAEMEVAAVARKSLVARRRIAAGTPLTNDMVTMMRPAAGLPATALPNLLGLVAVADIDAGTRLHREMFRPPAWAPQPQPRRRL